MIKYFDYTIDEVIENYKTAVLMKKIDNISQVVYYSDDKKDVTGNGSRQYFVKLDSVLQHLIRETGVKNGIVVCGSKHTTSSVYVNHFEPGILRDVLDTYRVMFPVQKKYHHNEWDFEYKNGAAHLKSISMGKSATVVIKDGEMILGDFENVIYAEFDTRPQKSFNILIIGE